MHCSQWPLISKWSNPGGLGHARTMNNKTIFQQVLSRVSRAFSEYAAEETGPSDPAFFGDDPFVSSADLSPAV